MKDLEGKVALVTGGSRGIGAAISKRLAERGAAVAVNYSGSKDRAESVAADINDAGGRAVAVQGDVSDPASVESMFRAVEQAFGPDLDILVNNAGVFELQGLHEATLADFDKTVGVNVRGVFDVTRHAAAKLRDGGRIITTGSCMGDRAMLPGAAIYSMSKAAVAGLTRGWAHDLAGRGITVNCVQPGPIDTEMNPDSDENPASGMMKDITALKRYGTADEVASLVSFLAGPESQYVTGQTLTIDGGVNA
ncbi:MAG: 3-oxoacyl-ACP reductase family protein [Planctomycetota bacterium]